MYAQNQYEPSLYFPSRREIRTYCGGYKTAKNPHTNQKIMRAENTHEHRTDIANSND
jgi:hypothetical protein